ncbi:MAG TPA: aldehyde dehydrogenase family protein, partial [Phycisphaerales bacterium]|nr:aldehyde dehydrogenase family protein [Phycisphaerales bacterium]
MPVNGMSIIAGRASTDTAAPFHSLNPATGEGSRHAYHAASSAEVDVAARAAADSFDEYAAHPSESKAAFLERCASEIASLGDDLVEMACWETGLAGPRIAGERDRTVNQFRFFAAMVRDGGWVEAVIDRGDPTRKPMPRPDLRRMLRPLGPVAVFGASNFPLAYSAGGGDTASALAAGCPVVVKGHPSHPGTGEMVAWAIARAAGECGLPGGVYGYLHAGGMREFDVGRELITHPGV